MNLLAILLAPLISCPYPKLENRTPTWNSTDVISYETAVMNCPQQYPNSPCLKRFIKVDTNRYFAICGKNQ